MYGTALALNIERETDRERGREGENGNDIFLLLLTNDWLGIISHGGQCAMPLKDNTIIVFSHVSFIISFVFMCSKKCGDFKIALMLIHKYNFSWFHFYVDLLNYFMIFYIKILSW